MLNNTFVQKVALTWSQAHCMMPVSSISPSWCVHYHQDSPEGYASTCCHDMERTSTTASIQTVHCHTND